MEHDTEQQILDTLKTIATDNAETAKRVAAFDARFEKIEAEQKALAAELDTADGAEAALAQERALRAGEGVTVEPSPLDPTCPELPAAEAAAGRKFSIARAMLGIGMQHESGPTGWVKAGAELERDTFQEMSRRNSSPEQRQQVHQIDSLGGFIVPEQTDSEVIELLRENSIVRAMGARVMGGLTGVPLRLPKKTGPTTHRWVGERQQIVDSEVTFGHVTLSPKKSAGLVFASQEFLRFGGAMADSIITADLAETLALGEDLAFLRGTGSSFQPLGVANHPNINTLSLGGTPTWEHFIDMMFELMNDNAFRGRLAWAYHSRFWRDIAKVFDADGRPIWNASGNTGDRPDQGTIYGIPTFISNQIPINLGAGTDTELYLGNWQDAVIGEWSGMVLARSDQFRFDTDEVAIKATRLTDFGLRHEESFILDNTLTP